MPTDRTIAFEFLNQLDLATDGAITGLSLTAIAILTWHGYKSTCSALCKINAAPTVRMSDLRCLLDESEQSSQQNQLVVVRGLVQAKSAIDGKWSSSNLNVLVSQETGVEGVVLEQSRSFVYDEWRGLFAWAFGRVNVLRNIIVNSSKNKKAKTLRKIPFVLVGSGQWPCLDHVVVNLDGSTHSIPLTTIYCNREPIQASPYTLLQALFGIAYPVGVLDEQKILPLGKEISAVGVCSLQDEIPQIKSCKDLPYFLSEMTKDQMVADLTFKANLLFWCGVVLGSFSIGILGCAITRNWRRLKDWRQQRRLRQSRDASIAAVINIQDDEEIEEVAEGQLCVVCLMRRRITAFVPCGHLVCCHRCALAVESESSPKCPVCSQVVSSCVRIYES